MRDRLETSDIPALKNLTKWRLFACIFGVVFGSWLGGVILIIFKSIFLYWDKPSAIILAVISGPAVGLIGMFVSLPLACFVIFLGVPFWWDERISLVKVMSVTAIGVGLLLIGELIIKGGAPLDAGLVLASALVSALICWRITKRWHSPESSP